MNGIRILFLVILVTIQSLFATDWLTHINAKKSLMRPEVYQLLRSQYDAFRTHNTLTTTAPLIKEIPIIESHEVCIDIFQCDNHRIAMLPTPDTAFACPDHNSGFASASKMRRTLFEKLEDLVKWLDLLAEEFGYVPGQMNIKIFEGLRDLTTQALLFENKTQEIRNDHPELSSEEIYAETSKWVSPIHNNIPVHSTGAAVDLRVWDTINEQFLDVGPFGVIWGSNSTAPTFSENLTDIQKKNRLYLLVAAAHAGLVNYSYEHWHFSYGDRYASFWQEHDKEHRKAIYGAVKKDDMKYLKKQNATKVQNSPTLTVWEYYIGDTDINTAIVELNGRYPEKGWAVNEKCKEMGLVIKGSGQLTTESQTISLAEGDLVLIPAGQKYFWQGEMTMVMPATPAWYPEQHKWCDI